MGDTFDFEPEKLQELVVYIAEQSQVDPGFGAVKLNKILNFADFYAYRKLGAPITGADYQKLPDGPAPRQLLSARARLLQDGSVMLENRPAFNHVQQRVVPKRSAKPVLSSEQLQVVDEVIKALWGKTAREVSDLSHEEPGWLLAQDYETIPYRTAWLSAEPPPQDVIERARRVAAEYAPPR
ncbi:MAG: DUF4065 domain-containing protein [Chloroflexi bacterium]|nr:DUF4065 domain-containing protein [Chloroflexota bacterium]